MWHVTMDDMWLDHFAPESNDNQLSGQEPVNLAQIGQKRNNFLAKLWHLYSGIIRTPEYELQNDTITEFCSSATLKKKNHQQRILV